VKTTLLIVLALVAAVATAFHVHSANLESTDDAFIDTRIVAISPRVAGRWPG